MVHLILSAPSPSPVFLIILLAKVLLRYSLHPDLGKYWDIGLFFDIEPELQRERIINRNGTESFLSFEEIWIPAEERYFEKYKIMAISDMVIV